MKEEDIGAMEWRREQLKTQLDTVEQMREETEVDMEEKRKLLKEHQVNIERVRRINEQHKVLLKPLTPLPTLPIYHQTTPTHHPPLHAFSPPHYFIALSTPSPFSPLPTLLQPFPDSLFLSSPLTISLLELFSTEV